MKKFPTINNKTVKIEKLISEDNEYVIQVDLLTPIVLTTDQKLILQVLKNLVHGVDSTYTIPSFPPKELHAK